MSNTYLFAGASSQIALHTTAILKNDGNRVLGISTKNEVTGYDTQFTIDNYHEGNYPEVAEPVDGLVYFPGTINLKPFSRFSMQEFVSDMQINVLGAVAFIRSYLNNLKQSRSASIVLISSVAASTGMPYHSSIGMAKAAIEGLTLSLAAELAPAIRVNAIAPSLMATPLGDRFINTPDKLEASQKRHPLKKVGTPQHAAEALSFLLSERSSWITGQIIGVDGGMGALKL